ncbi:MAG: metal-dependent transcriptional regulator [Deltaproteobacteria bacterium]|nr:metal-dependent transcriptional regulator [Deltaproteobacteria bacterium]
MENKSVINELTQKPLTPAMEDYLEAIYSLGKEKRAVRVKDIARRLGVKMPTVTNMLKTLSDREYIDYQKYEYIDLTGEGADVGREIHRRHRVLRGFLTDILNINLVTADEEACKMEHAISTETLERFVEFMAFVQSCPRTGANWLDRFEEYRVRGLDRARCLEHMKDFADGFKERMEVMEEGEVKNDGPQHG